MQWCLVISQWKLDVHFCFVLCLIISIYGTDFSYCAWVLCTSYFLVASNFCLSIIVRSWAHCPIFVYIILFPSANNTSLWNDCHHFALSYTTCLSSFIAMIIQFLWTAKYSASRYYLSHMFYFCGVRMMMGCLYNSSSYDNSQLDTNVKYVKICKNCTQITACFCRPVNSPPPFKRQNYIRNF